MTRGHCSAVAAACRSAWHPIRPTAPTAAGRIGVEHVAELEPLYGRDVVFVLGAESSRILEGSLQQQTSS